MLNWLGMPPAASAHAGEIDQMMVLVHWLMLVLFVGWGAFFLFVLVRFRRGANPKASYAGAKGKLVEGPRSGRRRRRSRAARVLRDSRVGEARAESSRRKAKPSSSASSASSSPGTCTIPEPDGKFGRTDVKLVSADNPLGLDRTDPDAKDDITDDQPAEPARSIVRCSCICRART